MVTFTENVPSEEKLSFVLCSVDESVSNLHRNFQYDLDKE